MIPVRLLTLLEKCITDRCFGSVRITFKDGGIVDVEETKHTKLENLPIPKLISADAEAK